MKFDNLLHGTTPPRPPEVFRVIDDGDCVVTTVNPYTALRALKVIMDKYDITSCWVDFEVLK